MSAEIAWGVICALVMAECLVFADDLRRDGYLNRARAMERLTFMILVMEAYGLFVLGR